MDQTKYNESLKLPLPSSPFSLSATPNPTNSTMAARYISNLSLAPGIVKLISSAGKMEPGSVKSASDFSYSASAYAGPNFRIVGDAGCQCPESLSGFIPPDFLHLPQLSSILSFPVAYIWLSRPRFQRLQQYVPLFEKTVLNTRPQNGTLDGSLSVTQGTTRTANSHW